MPKFVYHSDDGQLIHAGGLLLYDSYGVWLIKEFYKDGYKIVDPGGKYCFQDCNILNTICREFNEETYFTIPIEVSTLQRLLDANQAKFVYVCPDVNGQPTYAVLLVDTQRLQLPEDIQRKFFINRRKALLNNPYVPQQYFSSFELIYLRFTDLNKLFADFHFRLKQIVLNSFLKQFTK